MHDPLALLTDVARAVTAAALLAGALTLAATRRPALALGIFLDFLLAAGLLRLTGDPGWPILATAAGTVLLRRLVTTGLRIGGRAVADRPGSGGPATELVRRLVRPAWRR